MKKINNVCLTIFGIAILVCLFAGGLSFVGYIVALCIGGETATQICTFIYKSYLPIVIQVTSVVTGLGLILLYTTKQKALSIKDDKEEKENSEVKPQVENENSTAK